MQLSAAGRHTLVVVSAIQPGCVQDIHAFPVSAVQGFTLTLFLMNVSLGMKGFPCGLPFPWKHAHFGSSHVFVAEFSVDNALQSAHCSFPSSSHSSPSAAVPYSHVHLLTLSHLSVPQFNLNPASHSMHISIPSSSQSPPFAGEPFLHTHPASFSHRLVTALRL